MMLYLMRNPFDTGSLLALARDCMVDLIADHDPGVFEFDTQV